MNQHQQNTFCHSLRSDDFKYTYQLTITLQYFSYCCSYTVLFLNLRRHKSIIPIFKFKYKSECNIQITKDHLGEKCGTGVLPNSFQKVLGPFPVNWPEVQGKGLRMWCCSVNIVLLWLKPGLAAYTRQSALVGYLYGPKNLFQFLFSFTQNYSFILIYSFDLSEALLFTTFGFFLTLSLFIYGQSYLKRWFSSFSIQYKELKGNDPKTLHIHVN